MEWPHYLSGFAAIAIIFWQWWVGTEDWDEGYKRDSKIGRVVLLTLLSFQLFFVCWWLAILLVLISGWFLKKKWLAMGLAILIAITALGMERDRISDDSGSNIGYRIVHGCAPARVSPDDEVSAAPNPSAPSGKSPDETHAGAGKE